MPYTCPVCGFPELTEPPRTPDSGASYEICPSCGFQFGYDDESEGIDYVTWRRRWISEGMPWRSHNPAPAGWDPAAQLRAVEERPPGRGESGQALVELGGLLILIAAIVSALVAIGIPNMFSNQVGTAVASIFGSTATAPGSPGAGGPGTTGPAGTAPGTGPGGAAAAAALAKVRSAAANAQRIADGGGDGWGNPSTLTDHFDRHGPDFGSPDEEAYAREAQDFLQRALADRLPIKVAPDGTIRVYEPATNTFGSYNADGTTKTYFKPDLAKNPNYWDDQPGTDPWSEPPAGNPPGGEPGTGNGSGGSGGDSGGNGSGGGKPGGGEPPAGGEPAPPEVPPEVPPELPPELPFPEIPFL
jgi:uncharacterized membrane protein YgcG